MRVSRDDIFWRSRFFLALLQSLYHPFKVRQSNLENSATNPVHVSEQQVFNHILIVDQLASQQSNFVVASPTDVSQKVRYGELSTHCESIYSFSPTLQPISSFKVQISNTDVFSGKISSFRFLRASLEPLALIQCSISLTLEEFFCRQPHPQPWSNLYTHIFISVIMSAVLSLKTS